jgi:hypothetical protein
MRQAKWGWEKEKKFRPTHRWVLCLRCPDRNLKDSGVVFFSSVPTYIRVLRLKSNGLRKLRCVKNRTKIVALDIIFLLRYVFIWHGHGHGYRHGRFSFRFASLRFALFFASFPFRFPS